MHSKVIIASLACVMAASFANGRVSNASDAKAPQLKAQDTRCCNAPNEDGIIPVLYADTPYQNNDFCVFLQGLEYQSELANHLDLFHKSSSSLSVWTGYSSVYGYYFDVSQPQTNGDYYVTMGSMGRELATLYIYRSNGKCYGSVLSKFDARAKYYMNEVATSTEKNYYPNEGGQAITSNTGFSAVQHYGTYVYGSNDITTTRSTSSGGFNSSLNVKVHVDYYKNGSPNAVKDIKLALYLDGVQIRPSTVKKTNASGEYSITLNQGDGYFFKKLGSLQFAIFADGQTTYVEDKNGFKYPYLYSASSSTYLYSLKSVTYNVKIYPERSDRAAAYEITQAQTMIRGYINSFNGSALTTAVKTNYPAARTTYNSAENYYVSSIDVRKDHYACWDVLNHEYAHYACEVLNLCNTDCDEEHRYNEDLEIAHGYSYASRMAYSEGLATFIALAGQVKCAIYGSGYITQIADYAYEDGVNDIYFDCYETQYGQTYNPHNVCVEASVASILVKLLCSSYHFGETQVWNAIKNVGCDNATLARLLDEFIANNSAYREEILGIIESEGFLNQFKSLSIREPSAKWTIMFYMCASDLSPEGSIFKILEVPGQPADVNIIIECGGAVNSNLITRYHVRNQQLITDEYFYAQDSDSHMGDESTFEDFLFWGLENYPAENTGIIIWNHGRAINGICDDPNDWTGQYDAHWNKINDTLTVSETTTAFTNAFDYFGINKLEFIGYDACLMQVQDVADFNSDFFNYMIASEEEEVDFMWVYDEWIDCLYDKEDTITILKEIVDSFVFKNSQYQYTWEQTLSVLDLSKMATYRQMFENVAYRLNDLIFNNSSLTDRQVQEYYDDVIELAGQWSRRYGQTLSSSWDLYGTNDAYDFLDNLLGDDFFGKDEELVQIVKDLKNLMYPDKIMSPDPNVGEDEVATFSQNTRETLVIYKRSSLVRGGQWACRSHGLAMHVWSDEHQIYPASETRFDNWRQFFFQYRNNRYNEAN